MQSGLSQVALSRGGPLETEHPSGSLHADHWSSPGTTWAISLSQDVAVTVANVTFKECCQQGSRGATKRTPDLSDIKGLVQRGRRHDGSLEQYQP